MVRAPRPRGLKSATPKAGAPCGPDEKEIPVEKTNVACNLKFICKKQSISTLVIQCRRDACVHCLTIAIPLLESGSVDGQKGFRRCRRTRTRFRRCHFAYCNLSSRFRLIASRRCFVRAPGIPRFQIPLESNGLYQNKPASNAHCCSTVAPREPGRQD